MCQPFSLKISADPAITCMKQEGKSHKVDNIFISKNALKYSQLEIGTSMLNICQLTLWEPWKAWLTLRKKEEEEKKEEGRKEKEREGRRKNAGKERSREGGREGRIKKEREEKNMKRRYGKKWAPGNCFISLRQAFKNLIFWSNEFPQINYFGQPLELSLWRRKYPKWAWVRERLKKEREDVPNWRMLWNSTNSLFSSVSSVSSSHGQLLATPWTAAL